MQSKRGYCTRSFRIWRNGTTSGGRVPKNTTGFSASHDGLILPYEPSWSRAVYHLYVVLTGNRDGLIDFLKSRGIGTGIHYPIPLHLQKAYENHGYRLGEFPVTERVAQQILSLPMFPGLQAEQQSEVAAEIAKCVPVLTA